MMFSYKQNSSTQGQQLNGQVHGVLYITIQSHFQQHSKRVHVYSLQYKRKVDIVHVIL